MLLELLLIGAGAAMAYAGKEVNADLEDEINQINDKIRNLSDKAESKAKATVIRCSKALRKLANQRKEVMETTITEFADKAKKIKNIQFSEKVHVIGNVKEINPSLYRDCSNYVHTFLAGDMGFIGGIGLQLINILSSIESKRKPKQIFQKCERNMKW